MGTLLGVLQVLLGVFQLLLNGAKRAPLLLEEEPSGSQRQHDKKGAPNRNTPEGELENSLPERLDASNQKGDKCQYAGSNEASNGVVECWSKVILEEFHALATHLTSIDLILDVLFPVTASESILRCGLSIRFYHGNEG
jgi:hypothetical protein